MWGGVSLAGKLVNPLINVEDSHPEEAPPGLTDFFRSLNLTVVSARLRNALTPFHSEMEYLPAVVSYRGRLIQSEFFVLNSLLRIKALDMQRSVVEMDEEIGVVGASKVVLDDSKLVGVDWCVVDELNRIVVSRKVQDAVRQSGCIGCTFQRIDELEF